MLKRITRKRAAQLAWDLEVSFWDELAEGWEVNEANEAVANEQLGKNWFENDAGNSEVFGSVTDEHGQSWASVTVGRYQFRVASQTVDLKTGKVVKMEEVLKELGLR